MSYQSIFKIFFILLFINSCDHEDRTKLYVFECGKIIVKDVSLFSPGVDEGISKELTNSCYLIVHKKGSLLWDAGLNDAIGKEGIDMWDGAFNLRVEHSLISQLSEIGVDPLDINYLAISHAHGDHTGNANLFKNATLILQEEEYQAMFSDNAADFGFDPASYQELANNKIIKLNGDYDIFGDGSIIIKRALGHTPGHQMLYIKLTESGNIMLSGDLYHFTKNREHSRVPSFNFNKEATIASMHKIEKFLQDNNAALWIQHDLEQNKEIKHAPLFYQ